MIHLHTGDNHDFQAYAMFVPEKQYGFIFFTNSNKAEPFIMEIAPANKEIVEAVSHSGEEFIYCLEGKVSQREPLRLR